MVARYCKGKAGNSATATMAQARPAAMGRMTPPWRRTARRHGEIGGRASTNRKSRTMTRRRGYYGKDDGLKPPEKASERGPPGDGRAGRGGRSGLGRVRLWRGRRVERCDAPGGRGGSEGSGPQAQAQAPWQWHRRRVAPHNQTMHCAPFVRQRENEGEREGHQMTNQYK